MVFWQGRSKRKPSGARFWPLRKKRAREMGSDPVYTKLSEEVKRKPRRQRSARKTKRVTTITGASHANVNTKDKTQKVKILAVKENPANRHFVRMNVISKGAIIETEAGLAKVTSRPTRDGVVNAILIKKK
ncbi:30S ribosomal protein S8e [Candidatus Woesearchaeota archaeon]|nr:30S ribosomal protein S8e [Candidatus Woesearchaeota archaeon]